MIYETDVPGWPYKILVGREGDEALSREHFYSYGSGEIVDFNTRWTDKTIVRWEYAENKNIAKWWFYFRNDEDALRALTIIGGI